MKNQNKLAYIICIFFLVIGIMSMLQTYITVDQQFKNQEKEIRVDTKLQEVKHVNTKQSNIKHKPASSFQGTYVGFYNDKLMEFQTDYHATSFTFPKEQTYYVNPNNMEYHEAYTSWSKILELRWYGILFLIIGISFFTIYKQPTKEESGEN